MLRISTSKVWFVIHVLIPLLPFVGTGLLRLIVCQTWSSEPFSTSELAISLALLSIFVNQSLVMSKHAMGSSEDAQTRRALAYAWVFIGALFFVFFALIVAFQTAVVELGASVLGSPLLVFKVIAWILAFPVVYGAIRMQKAFKLRATI